MLLVSLQMRQYFVIYSLQRTAKLCNRCICYYDISVRPSVHLSDVRQSAILWYCVKTTERRGMRSSPSGSTVSIVM